MAIVEDCFDKIINDKIGDIADTLAPVVNRDPTGLTPVVPKYEMVYTIPDYSRAELISSNPVYATGDGYSIEFTADFDGYVVVNYSNTNMNDSNMNTATRMVVFKSLPDVYSCLGHSV